jgi:hypothetical protein
VPTLTQGSTASVSVTNGQYVSFKNGPRDSARIDLGNGMPHKVHHNGAAVYGPFSAQSLRLAAVSGAVVYVTGSLATVAPMGRL